MTDTNIPEDTNFTPDQWRRIRKFAQAKQNNNARESILRKTTDSNRHHDPVTPQECKRIRKLRRQGTFFIDIASQLEIGASAARYHAHAECTHDVEIPPVPKKETTDGGDA